MLALLPLLLISVADTGEESHYLDASLDLDGKLLSWRFVDLEDDGTRELLLAIAATNGERELRIHRLQKEGLQREAQTTVPILPDVLAWGVADVRDEPGRELIFLTRAGAWSYSLTLPGYRDNVQRLAREELIYDMPDPRELPYWAYVLPAEGGDSLLLPGRERLSIWGPAAKGEATEEDDATLAYAMRTALPTAGEEATTAELGSEGRNRGDGPRVSIEEDSPFLPEGKDGGSSLLEDAHATTAPALQDVNGDGYLDLVFLRDEQLKLYLGGQSGLPATATRVEALPEPLLDNDDREVHLRLRDVNGDGLFDLIAKVGAAPDGFENRLFRILIYRAREGRLIAEEPDQVLRFEAGDMNIHIVDVDADGRMDLAVEKLTLPSLVGAVTGIEFEFSLLVFPGEPRGFARRPAFTRVETFDEESAIELAANRVWTHDCNGDGTADLVEIDLQGDIAIRRLRQEKSRLRGSSWSLDRAPWKHYEIEGSIDSLTVEDFNNDGLGDIVSASDERLTILLSVDKGSQR